MIDLDEILLFMNIEKSDILDSLLKRTAILHFSPIHFALKFRKLFELVFSFFFKRLKIAHNKRFLLLYCSRVEKRFIRVDL